MKKFMEVNGIIFEVKKPITRKTDCDRKLLGECYKHPSRAKQAIYYYWVQWVLDSFSEFCNFGIESYNIHMFTLGWNTTEGEYCVTKTRQEFYPYYK